MGNDSEKKSKTRTDWDKAHKPLDRQRKEHFDSISFRPHPVMVAHDEMGAFNPSSELGYPGEYPFTRGIHPNLYRGKLWTMRQFAGFGTPEDTNARFRFLLANGQTGLSTAFDMPTLMGYDADHALSKGEVGREGVSLCTIEDMEILFREIDLTQVTVSMTINCTAPVAMAMYFALARRRGYDFAKLGGTIQNDMLKEFIAQKEWISPPAPSVKLSCDIIEYCSQFAPRFHGISISGYHIREAGATAAQELAFTLADGLAYVQHCVERGMPVDSFAPRLSFFFDVHNDFFEEVAKFRAARRMWARFMKERFDAKEIKSMQLRTHAQTAGVSLTAQQPTNNVARVALQALAAVLGGVQSLHTNSMDETLSLPTEQAVKVALRTQQIIAEETGVADVVDPLGGSYYVEQLTSQIESEALSYIEKIDALGGMLSAVEQGYPQKELAEASYEFQKRVDNDLYRIVGVNSYKDVGDEDGIPTHSVDLEVENRQRARVVDFKKARDQKAVASSLEAVRNACQNNENVMPALIDAVDNGITVGEVSDIFREVFGVYRDPGLL
ncbi:MAG: methylmalonyl-CoA mutase [Bdellovibrionales bacterium]|nr:methylmalonyl-CoA mutase [Bdellovibrionales bacterium]